MMPQSPSKQAPWDLPQFSQSPSAVPSHFPESHRQSEITSLSKLILVLGKARSRRAPNLGCRGAESPGSLDVSQKNCTRHDAWAGALLSWWSCQSPVAHSCSLLNHLNGFCGGMFKLHTKSDADSLLYLRSHFECDSHTVQHSHSMSSTTPTDSYSEVVTVHTSVFQPTLLGCQVTLMSCKPFSLC